MRKLAVPRITVNVRVDRDVKEAIDLLPVSSEDGIPLRDLSSKLRRLTNVYRAYEGMK